MERRPHNPLISTKSSASIDLPQPTTYARRIANELVKRIQMPVAMLVPFKQFRPRGKCSVILSADVPTTEPAHGRSGRAGLRFPICSACQRSPPSGEWQRVDSHLGLA